MSHEHKASAFSKRQRDFRYSSREEHLQPMRLHSQRAGHNTVAAERLAHAPRQPVVGQDSVSK